MSTHGFDPALDPFVSARDGVATPQEVTTRSVTDLIERNPLPAALAAAAVGAGLMALVALLARQSSAPRVPEAIPTTRPGLDLEGLKQQIAELSSRLGESIPTAGARQRIDDAGDALAQGWGTVRDHAFDAFDRVLGPLEPQASAALKAVRQHPVWGAMIVGVIGALVGTQWLGKTTTEAPVDTSSDTSGDT